VEPVGGSGYLRLYLSARDVLTVLIYVLIATVVAVWLGRPLIWLSFDNEKLNAAFRYASSACETPPRRWASTVVSE